jgi:CRISPR system Cascade subunit CasD
MSIEQTDQGRKYLALRLQGPLQSWGVDSQYSRRNTALMPTKSALAGMCCAALGIARGCDEEAPFLQQFSTLRMTAIAIQDSAKDLPVRRLLDYHTVQNTKKADGGLKPSHITHRQYLTDASFGVVLAGEAALLKRIADALANPVWGIWLGRKTCIPTVPVLAGLFDSNDDAFKELIGNEPVESFTRQEEAESFADGRDSLPDQPLSFNSDQRLFSPRRIHLIHGSSSR